MRLFTPPTRKIEFLCTPEDEGVIAPPVPGKEHLPDWFRKLPAVDRSKHGTTDTGLTVKRCMPFIDAMTTGYVLPLAATVRLEIRDGGRTVTAGWDFDKTMVSNHGPHQVAGHPASPTPPCKFHNYWSIRTPRGWSCLFVPVLNRANPVFEPVAGVVDTDSYTAPVHFPFFATAPDGLYELEKGTPLVQVIPFRRDTTDLAPSVRAERPAEALQRQRVTRSTTASTGWYRRFARAQR
ncbi:MULTISPECIES: DUF6065 family protein [unclassified Devosia]|uniref:DUF6065 family protein n=1 Tax=unclassified Devosia TaxID=196773 RepID=UPI00086E6294|nr:MULTISPECIES: DUF6065 family protein [unclassified Devosia]MBN9365301.1 hypothetical protein [Devosia sp.]ODS85028.1 MAG: hypothetical protein ABS47_18025 [Devosia sp. SCN 66-27]OJX21598.1 MAG: hypothetical protein BGO83_02145 [Devosia sp. 66-14]